MPAAFSLCPQGFLFSNSATVGKTVLVGGWGQWKTPSLLIPVESYVQSLHIKDSFIHYYSALEAGLAGTRAQSCDRPVWLWHTDILGKFLGVVCHCFPPSLDVPTFAARCLYVRNDARDPRSERWNCGREICPVILPKFRLPRKFMDLLHAANLRHGTDGFNSPPKEGVLRIFSP